MAKILRIILIDSLCRGEKAEINVDGNTSLTGTNGIGKSSILRLIPVFYGAAPGTVVKADGNNKSFADWYLPNESSFIIFEFLNFENIVCCAILHRAGAGYAYRLVSGGWDDSLLYLDAEAGILVSPQNLMTHLRELLRSCTPALPTGSYRRIIQFNTGNANLDGVDDMQQRKEIEQNRRLYSLAPKRQEFSGIDTVTLAMINEGHSFESVGQVMADILQQDHGDIEAVLEAIRHQPFQSLLQDIESYGLFEREVRGKIITLDNLLTDFQAKTYSLRRAKQRSLLLKADLQRQSHKVDTDIEYLEAQKREQDECRDSHRKGLSQQIGKAEADVSRHEATVQRIEQQRDEYAASDMDGMQALCLQGPAIEQQRQQIISEAAILQEQGADVRAKYKELAQAAKDDTQALIDAQRSVADKAIVAVEHRREAQRGEARQRIERIKAEHDSTNAELDNEIKQVSTDLTRQQEAITQLVGFGVLPQDQTAINDAISLADTCHEQCRQQQLVVTDVNRQLIGLKEERDNLAAAKSALDRDTQKQEQERDRLTAALNAKGDTLLGFLRQHHPDWIDNIAKLVPDSVLMRSDLNPDLLAGADSPRSLYGVVLSLDHLQAPSIANTDSLRDDIARVVSSLQHLDDELTELAKRSRKLEERLRSAEDAHGRAKQSRARLEDEWENAKSAIEGVRQRAVSHFDSYIDKLKTGSRKQADELTRLKTLDKDNRASQGREMLGIRSNAEAQESEGKAEIDTLRQQLEGFIAQHGQRLTATLSEYDRAMDKELKDAGIDDSRNRVLQRDLKQLDQTLEKIKRSTALVQEYRQWRENTLPCLETEKADLDEAEARRESIERQLQQLDEVSRQHNEAYKASLRDMQGLRGELDRDLSGADRLIDLLDSIEPDDEAVLSPHQRIADIDHDAREALQTRSRIGKQARSCYADITNIYRSRNRNLSQSPHALTIENIEREARRETDTDDLRWIIAAERLKADMESFHFEQRNKLLMKAHNLSSGISDSKHRLEHLHRSILSLGRKATDKAASVATAFPSIEAIEFVVKSNIRDLEFWSDLDNYEREYQRWRSQGEDTMPTQAFISALEHFELRVRDQKLSRRIVDCFSVHVELTDKGERKRAWNNSQFNHITSEGLRKIVLCMLFLSLFELLRKDADLTLIIPLDESLKLKAENYISLVASFNVRSTVAFAACPDAQPELLSQFQNVYALRASQGGIKIVQFETLDDQGQWSEDEFNQLFEAVSS